MRKIEVCCTSVADVIEAYCGGAVRVELCSAIGCGGVTPGYGLVTETLAAVRSLCAQDAARERMRVNVLIRPREGSFYYSQFEVRTMLSDIRFYRSAGVDGVVIGALTPDGDIDLDACSEMVAAASGMDVTFHRAFDMTADPEAALEQIIGLGCDRLLTSGQQPSALAGAKLISRLVKCAGDRIIVMPGSGVNPSNIAEIEYITGAVEYHSTARAAVPDPNRRQVPSLGFDEPAADIPSSDSLPVRHILRTSRDVVRALISTGYPF